MTSVVRRQLADILERLAKRIRPKRRVLVCAKLGHTFEDPDPNNKFEAGVFCPACKEMGFIAVGVCHPRYVED